MPTDFYGLVGYDRIKNYPLWLKNVSIPDQHPLYLAVSLMMHPRSNPALPDQSPSFRLTNSRSARPTHDLFLIQLRSLNIGPNPDLLISTTFCWKFTRPRRTFLKIEISYSNNIRFKIVCLCCINVVYGPSLFIKSLNEINLESLLL